MHRQLALFSTLVMMCGAALPETVWAEETDLQPVTSIEGIIEYRLDNGLKVLLFPDPSKATVTINLTIFVGSRHEGYGEAGMAHLLEHMLFKGTPAHPDVPKVLKERGAEFNGTTWLDRTNYFETLPASNENLEFAIRLEADRMVNSYVKAEDLASEMTVVRSEFERGENSPSRVLRQKMFAAAYEWHNYGKSTIGNRADIERVPIDKLRRFYKKYYQPDNAMLVVAGRFDPEQALEYIQKSFGILPRPERELDNTYTEEPAQDGERLVTLRRVGEVALVGLMYHIPSGAHADYPALDVLEGILTHEPAGRLYKALVETKKASDIAGYAYALHDPGVLELLAEVPSGNAPEATLDSMFEVIDKVAEEGVTPDEVARVKQRLLKNRELAAANSRQIAIQLSEWAAQGDWRLYFLYRDRLENVTAEDVDRVAETYLKRNNRTVGMFLPTEEPQRVEVPATPNLAEIIGDYKGRDEVAVGEQFDPSPQNIEARAKRINLPSGVRAVLLPKKTRGESVNLQLTLRYGNAEDLQGMLHATKILPTLMLRGTKQFSRQQLQDELDKYRAQLSASSSAAGEATFTLQTKREHLLDVLNLLRQILREPTLPAEEFEILRQSLVTSKEQQLNDPQSLATTTVRQYLSPYPAGDPRHVPAIEEEIELLKAVTIEDVRRLYRDHLNGEHGELAVVGDFETEPVTAALAEMLSGWEATIPYKRLEYTGDVKLKAETRVILTPDKANATYFSATVLPLSDTDPDYAELQIGNHVFGSSGLSSRLGDRVRQKEGLSYGVGSGFDARSLDERAAMYMYAICNPANMDRVKAAIHEELVRLLKEGITAEELAAAQQGYLQQQQVRRTSDASLAAILADTAFADRTMKYYEELEAEITAMSTEDILRALKKHIDPQRFVLVTAGDFQKDAATE